MFVYVSVKTLNSTSKAGREEMSPTHEVCHHARAGQGISDAAVTQELAISPGSTTATRSGQ